MNYYAAIKKQYPDIKNTEFKLQDNGDGIVYIAEWNYDLSPAPDLKDLQISAAQCELIGQIQSNRMRDYLSIGDQLDMIYWDKINGTDIWQDHVTSVKLKYPKPQ